MRNFALGFITAMLLMLVTTTTPDKAVANLKGWYKSISESN